MSKYDKLFERIANYSILNKDNALQKHVLYMLDKLESLIDVKGLPLTIPKRIFVRYLLINGFVVIAEHEDNLFAFYAGLGGVPDVNYDFTEAVVSNPALKLTKTFKIDEDCVLIRNDSSMLGVIPILEKFGTLDTEVMITFRLMAINNRISALINADDDAGYASAKQFLKDVEDGKLGVIQSGGFFDGVTTNDFANRAGDIKDMIELKSFLDAKEWEEFGININGNAKREYVSDTEMDIGQPATLPFISNMLEQWREGIAKVNAMFGTEIEVDFTPLIQYVEERSTENEEPQSGSEAEGVVSEDDSDVKEYTIGEDKPEEAETEEVTEEGSGDDGEESGTEEIAEDLEEVTEEEIVEAEKAKKGEDNDYSTEDAPDTEEVEEETEEEGDEDNGDEEDKERD